jgi:hypothetical protein
VIGKGHATDAFSVFSEIASLSSSDSAPSTSSSSDSESSSISESDTSSQNNEIVIKKPVLKIVDSSSDIESIKTSSSPISSASISSVNLDEKKESEQHLELTAAPSSENSISSAKLGGSGSDDSDKSVYIDTHDLTGKKGLARVMKFIDSKSPPEKGSFEYKTDKYGRIFSPDEIGKYSSKIKLICDKVNSSEGILLVYCQYIDGGILPMALALEEMGITKFGGTNLLKNKPSLSSPHKYIMITGDTRLSPNNAAHIKAATNENNKNGEKVKVILISKAGSEGVDFKYIRQVHILDPWYNMNLIEQVVGRAVRNMSHKDLPFEKRNVEIYLHATLLEDNKEEAADLYVFRVAEYKSVQIGRVTRILKEVSVDCILNHDQTNFTQKNMKTSVKQILSSGNVIQEFPIGDLPFTAASDYMENCEYKCNPSKEITNKDINENTYDESFIVLNSDKIIQKVKNLMKERFLYKKKDLISRINNPKVYPLVEIYSALTQLVDDNKETIIDKYGRYGYLINIGEYYLFQPNEVTHPESSIFERSVPLDNKYEMINLDIKNLSENKLEKVEKVDEVLHEKIERDEDKEIVLLRELEEKYNMVASNISESSLKKGENDWYSQAGYVMHKLITEESFSEEDVLEFLVHHIVDLLLFSEKITLLNYMTNKKNTDVMTKFELAVKTYIDKFMIQDKGLVGIILFDENKRNLMILDNSSKKWKEGEPQDEKDLSNAIKKMYSVSENSFNNLVGFIGYEPKNKHFVFKVKDMQAKRTTGARCDQATKAKTIAMLNKIVGSEKWTKENTKKIVDSGLCIVEEFVLRKYNKERKNNKIWFLTPEMAKIYKVSS